MPTVRVPAFSACIPRFTSTSSFGGGATRLWLATLELLCEVPLTRFSMSGRPSLGLGPGESTTTSDSRIGRCPLRDLGTPFRGAGSSEDRIAFRTAKLLTMSYSSWTFFSDSECLIFSRYKLSRRRCCSGVESVFCQPHSVPRSSVSYDQQT